MGLFGTYSERELRRIKKPLKEVLDLAPAYAALSDDELRAKTPYFKEKLAQGATLDDILPEAFATVREAAARVLGQTPFPVQVQGGIILHQGRIAEMKTGEGKTLTCTMPAYLNALNGKGVHIVTVNDYLARRDSEWMGKIYRFLGLTCGLIVHDLDKNARREAYACDITYGTNNELGFDYLRDNMVIYKRDKVQRGFNYAIVDEVDSILIDEARTPLIISGQGDKSTDMYTLADNFARTLKAFRVKEMDRKDDQEDVDGDYIVDEKAKTATLTKSGIAKAEAFFHVENLSDAENMTLQHHINQAIKARGVMKRDVDYVVKDGEVIIVDEFTGRLMLGRRFNEGLHQAIEAKENVQVLRESKTLATITFQNFFRLYKKLSGMTGTAMTEDAEFREIYGIDVVEIPTNKPVIRVDHPDAIYRTEDAKFRAVIRQVIDCHEKGQPVLVGTISIEKSEQLSKLLKKQGIPHNVLNAKYHEKEAEIVAQAGRLGAVTIATNMAGRGTDIMLGGNAEFLAKAEMRKKGYYEELISNATAFFETEDPEILEARETFRRLLAESKESIKNEADKVRAAGGLFIIGTERHESRRIDNQLRGRSGRQGDPGESRFYISMEDDMMRLFGGERLGAIMDRLGADPDTAIENRIVTNSLEQAQKKVEGRNFAVRKSVLSFDDVNNKQREIIYGQRSEVLDGADMKPVITKMVDEYVDQTVNMYVPADTDSAHWNLIGLREYLLGFLTTDDDFSYSPEELKAVRREDIHQLLSDRIHKLYDDREKELGEELMRELERVILLRNVDTKWMDHIDAMAELKRGIGMRAYAQRDPVVEYRIEGFAMFDEMIAAIRTDTVRQLLTVRLRRETPMQRVQVAKPTTASVGDGAQEVKKTPVRRKVEVGRNDPCPCGSGKKYKNCCWEKDHQVTNPSAPSDGK